MFSAITILLINLLQGWLQPEVLVLHKSSFVRLVAIGLFALSVGLPLVNRFGWLSPSALVSFGTVYEVAAAFAISALEHSVRWSSNVPIRGTSWLSVWIVVCGLLIPSTRRRSLLTGMTAAAMGPVAYFVATAALDNPPLAAKRLALWSFLPFLMAGWTAILNRRLFSLEVDVSRAKDMGSYHLEALLGRGGMGEVWRAKHRLLALGAAVKLIRPETLMLQTGKQAEIIRRRFEREARATAALRSPHTVALYDFGVSEEGAFYYVMELLDGINLEQLVKRYGPLPPARVIKLLLDACDSLAEAHQIGLVHRDVKPTNLFICRLGLNVDFVKVLDFGLVKSMLQNGETKMTLDGMTTGTPAYMAPEVAMGTDEIDGRADIYGLGCVAYWLLTGQLVFEESTPVAMAIAHVQNPLVPPSVRTELPVPGCLERVVMACLEKKPDDRPQTALELAALLERCIPEVGEWTRDDAQRWW
ncbi:MAG TPA: serine/threonine-protein kinase, partial [Bryobacteraceae bacterium]|nr:serine/threonine-protein kinase [Bryobacteraceae bacterium]